MKHLYSAFLKLMLLLPVLAAAQENAFYYYQNNPFTIQLSYNYVYIHTDSTLQEADLKNIAASVDADLEVFMQDNLYYLKSPDGKEIKNTGNHARLKFKKELIPADYYNTVVAQLKKTAHIDYVSTCYTDGKHVACSTRYVLVKLRNPDGLTQMEQVAKQNGIDIMGYNSYIPLLYTLKLPLNNTLGTLKTANMIYETGYFAYSEPDMLQEVIPNSDYDPNPFSMLKKKTIANYTPISDPVAVNDTYYSYQWGLKNTGQEGGVAGIDIKAPDAWAISSGSADIKVGIYDTGVELTHPELSAAVLGGGYDIVSGGAQTIAELHATSVAGIIAATKNNNVGVAGIAPLCKIVSIRMPIASLSAQQIASGFNYAHNQDIRVLNCSWGIWLPSQILIDAINACIDGDMVIVFAMGNFDENGADYPGSVNPLILCVGGVDRCGARSGKTSYVPASCDPWCDTCNGHASNYGNYLDIMAPGTNVPTTDMVNAGYNTTSTPLDFTDKSYTRFFWGTSAAAPHVAAVAALMISANPTLTVEQVNKVIESTAQKIRPDLYNYLDNPDRPNGTWNKYTGYGMVDAYAALKHICPYDVNVTVTPITYSIDNIVASHDITASNTLIENNTMTYDAGNSITLTNGFYAAQNVNFLAKIGGCDGSSLLRQAAPANSGSVENSTGNESVAEIIRSPEKSVYLTPNPATNRINIIAGNNIKSVVIYALDGKVMHNQNYTDTPKEADIDISAFAQGYYIVIITDANGEIQTKKLIKN